MKLIDTHCHFNHHQLEGDIQGAISRAQAANVEKFIVVGYDLPSSRLAVEQAAKYDSVYAAVGIHPHDAKTFNQEALEEIKALSQHPKVVAIGEIGLDFYRDLSPRPLQYEAFRQQMALADELDMPIIIHCRDAYPDLMDVLEAEMPESIRGVVHCFGGEQKDADHALALGFYLGFDGPITYKSADALRDVLKNTPKDRVLIETDAPYLTPHPYRGKRNEPSYVPLVAHKAAEVLQMPYESFARQSTGNAEQLFPRLKD